MSAPTPDLDAVVVAYRSRATIGPCLDALRSLQGLKDLVVVDHGDDGSGEVAAARGARVVHDAANPGFGAGVNRGLRLGDAPFVLLVNPDARMIANGVTAGVALLGSRPEVGVVQGLIESSTGAEPDRSQGSDIAPVHLWGRALGMRGLLGLALIRGLARRVPAVADHADRVPGSAIEVESLAATAWLARRSALEAVGGFDERYFLYGEDLDLCRRLRHAGWRLVALPDPWALHAGGASSATGWERELHWWQGTMRYAAQWWGGTAWMLAQSAAILRWLRLAARRPRSAVQAWQAMIRVPRQVRSVR